MIYLYPKVFWNFDTDQNCSELYIHVYIPGLKSIYKILFYLEYICLYSLKSDTLDTLIFASKKFHTFEFIMWISYFYFSYFSFPPL